MAKGKTFIGLKRGQAAGLVYSIGRAASGKRQQIVRGLAEQVSNPQSSAQATQRCYLAGAAKFTAIMKKISDHAIEGYPWGQANRAQFMKNLLSMSAGLRLYSPKGVNGVYGVAGAKVPISKGSLQGYQYAAVISSGAISVGDTWTADMMATLGLSEGDILTIVYFSNLSSTSGLMSGEPTYKQILVSEGASIVDIVSGSAMTLKYSIDSDGTIKMSAAVGNSASSYGAIIHESRTDDDYKRSDAYFVWPLTGSVLFTAAKSTYEASATATLSVGATYLDGSAAATQTLTLCILGVQDKNSNSTSFGKWLQCLGGYDGNGNYYYFVDANSALINPDGSSMTTLDANGDSVPATTTALDSTPSCIWETYYDIGSVEVTPTSKTYSADYGTLANTGTDA